MATNPGVELLEDAPVVGLADRAAELRELPADEMAEQMRAHAFAADLPLPGGRGVPQVFEWIAERLKQRELVSDLGEHSTDVDWLAFHVPPGGAGSLMVRNQGEVDHGVELKVLGSGFGSGRVVRLSVAENFLERKRCMRLVQQVDVHVRSYVTSGSSSGAAPEITGDVVRVRTTRVVPWEKCPLCGALTTSLDPFEYEPAGPGIDLTQDDTGQQRSEKVEVETRDEREFGLSLDVPGIGPFGASLIARRTLNLVCEVEYSFPAKVHVTPFKPVDNFTGLPFWGVE